MDGRTYHVKTTLVIEIDSIIMVANPDSVQWRMAALYDAITQQCHDTANGMAYRGGIHALAVAAPTIHVAEVSTAREEMHRTLDAAIGPTRVDRLISVGCVTPAVVAIAPDRSLGVIRGFGDVTMRALREAIPYTGTYTREEAE